MIILITGLLLTLKLAVILAIFAAVLLGIGGIILFNSWVNILVVFGIIIAYKVIRDRV